ncbi:MAG: hypothetical protein FWB93_03390 [Oscillospiraceae bacterium]|nr:hypothetical protein [Oscillospiraceae bacterium]
MNDRLNNFIECYNFCYDFLKEHIENYNLMEKKRVAYVTKMPEDIFEIVLCLEVAHGDKKHLVKNFYYHFNYPPWHKHRKESLSMKTFLQAMEFLCNEGCEVRFNLAWGKEQGLWEHST